GESAQLECTLQFHGIAGWSKSPFGALIRDKAGNLYGTTSGGGASCDIPGGCGTVFKLDPSGSETVLYRFAGPPDGGAPFAALIRDKAGNLCAPHLSAAT
ncbi:MAG: hypothetical protein DMG24_18500, partial [Acidobacteria bacterium]